jgi:hypothetical protein
VTARGRGPEEQVGRAKQIPWRGERPAANQGGQGMFVDRQGVREIVIRHQQGINAALPKAQFPDRLSTVKQIYIPI